MSHRSYRIRPWADRIARRRAVREIQRLVESGRYVVPADQVAEAFLVEAGFPEPESSSWRGRDADAN